MTRPTARPPTFSHVRIFVSDFARSWRFYGEVLGLTPARGHGRPPYGEFVSRTGAIVSLFERRAMTEALGLRPGRTSARSIGSSAVIFAVEDVDAAARRLRRRGVRLVAGPTSRPAWGLRTVHLRDPDGYLVELYSGIPPG